MKAGFVYDHGYDHVMPVQISLSEFRIWIRARRFFGGLSAMAVAERFGLN